MKSVLQILIATGIATCGVSVSLADHLAVEAIAQQIADSSGGDAEDYIAYATSLADTLGVIDPTKLREAMGAENYAKIADGSSSLASNMSASLLSNPEYQAVLSAYGTAYEAYALAQHRMDSADAAVQAVLADEAGLKSDEIVGNYLEALVGALYEFRKAEVALELADTAQQEAQMAVESFHADSHDDHDHDHDHDEGEGEHQEGESESNS